MIKHFESIATKTFTCDKVNTHWYPAGRHSPLSARLSGPTTVNIPRWTRIIEQLFALWSSNNHFCHENCNCFFRVMSSFFIFISSFVYADILVRAPVMILQNFYVYGQIEFNVLVGYYGTQKNLGRLYRSVAKNF